MKNQFLGEEILTFYDECDWVACWIRKNIVAQGSTEDIAVERLYILIAIHCIISMSAGDSLMKDIPEPSIETLVRWRAKHIKAHKETE